MTTLDDVRALVLGQPGAWEDTPFGPEALVYKVGPKMFALVAWQATPLTISLKCKRFSTREDSREELKPTLK